MNTLKVASKKTITMKDVALHAGVTHSSVSVVLNGSRSNTGVSPATRQRILAAAEELGYRRNGSAHTIRTGRFGNIALVLTQHTRRSYLPPQLLSGLHDALAAADVSLTVCMLPEEKLNESSTLPKILRERMCDGLLIDYTSNIPKSMIDSIDRHQMPAVWLNLKQPTDCVHPDDFEAAFQATQYLLSLGHQRIAYVDFSNNPYDLHSHYSVKDRCDGYTTAMQKARLQPETWPLQQCAGDPIGFCERQMRRSKRVTAIIAYAVYSLDAVWAVAAKLGRRVPDDLSIVTFGPEQANSMHMTLTMFIEPHRDLARSATQMLMDKIQHASHTTPTQIARFYLMEGQSTAPPSRTPEAGAQRTG